MAAPYNPGYTPMMAPTTAPYSGIEPALPRYIKPEDLPPHVRQPSSSRHHHQQHHRQSIDSNPAMSAATKTPTQAVVLPPPSSSYRTPENAERPHSKNSYAQTLIPGERLRPRFSEDPTTTPTARTIQQPHLPGIYPSRTHHLPVLVTVLLQIIRLLLEALIRILSPVADRRCLTVLRTWTTTGWA